MKVNKQFFFLFIGALCLLNSAQAIVVAEDSNYEQFVTEMTQQGFNRAYLEQLFQAVEIDQSILKIMKRAVGKPSPWYKYRTKFIDAKRIRDGVAFWAENEQALTQAERIYGVPAEIIVAIIGVETIYGQNTGNFRVLDALTTLAFHYPRRAEYFRQELKEFLLLTREEQVSPLSLTGSYAGAMGLGQFMPSSYRNYGVDFDGDGRRDLWANPTDVIGSVANYFVKHGWERGGTIVMPAQAKANFADDLDLKPQYTLGQLKRQGLIFEGKESDSVLGSVLRLETELGNAHWFTFKNFYVITRYNHSRRYAMAVNHLAEAVKQKRYEYLLH